MWNKELSLDLNNNYDLSPDLLRGFSKLLSQEHGKEKSCCWIIPRLCVSPEADRSYGDIPGWHCHLQLPDSAAGRESLSALCEMGGRGVSCIRLDVSWSSWKSALFQGQLYPLKNDRTLPFCTPRGPNHRGKLPAKLYFNMGLMDWTSHTGQKKHCPYPGFLQTQVPRYETLVISGSGKCFHCKKCVSSSRRFVPTSHLVTSALLLTIRFLSFFC